MTIVGLGGLLNDAACAVLREGELVAAVEQTKVAHRHERGKLPYEAIQAAVNLAGVSPQSVDAVALARPLAIGYETELHLSLRAQFPNSQLFIVEHHLAHAASAFYPSPFEEATILTLDHMGDFRCGARWQGSGNQIVAERDLFYPDSLGGLYSRVTELLGFRARAEEHKVQWLSAGAEPVLRVFDEILGGDSWPRMDYSFFDSGRVSRGGFSAKFYQALGLSDDAPIPTAMRAELAASLQHSIEECVLRMAGAGENLCLAGGLAFNALLIAALERKKNVFAQPAAGNAGTAIGAVLHTWHSSSGNVRGQLGDMCLGPSYGADEVKRVVENCKLGFRYLPTNEDLIGGAVKEIHDHKIIAWMQGRMEFGPRALGNRSILASPLDPYSSENLNTYIKHREPFRKFAASVPAELAGEYFETGPNARYLATLGRVKPQHRKLFASAILGHDLIRVHTVHQKDNPLYHRLLLAAGESAGLPVLYNTSFNLFGDPLVCTPRDAVRSFFSSGIDALFVGNFFLEK